MKDRKKDKFNGQKSEYQGDERPEETPEVSIDDISSENEPVGEQDLESEILRLNSELEASRASVENEKKEYMFLMAEFDNFRKRTLKEKSEIIKNAGEQVLKGLLPILDDFERGIEAAGKTDNAESVKEGMMLIYNKFKKFLEQNGVKEIDPEDRVFDTERHEAISVVPVPAEDQKGKILDTVQKGYTINDKVLRHAKVVVGQ